MSPELVGQEGFIDKVTKTQGEYKYAINGLSKYAWYNEDQLEKVLSASEIETVPGEVTSPEKTD